MPPDTPSHCPHTPRLWARHCSSADPVQGLRGEHHPRACAESIAYRRRNNFAVFFAFLAFAAGFLALTAFLAAFLTTFLAAFFTGFSALGGAFLAGGFFA